MDDLRVAARVGRTFRYENQHAGGLVQFQPPAMLCVVSAG